MRHAGDPVSGGVRAHGSVGHLKAVLHRWAGTGVTWGRALPREALGQKAKWGSVTGSTWGDLESPIPAGWEQGPRCHSRNTGLPGAGAWR